MYDNSAPKLTLSPSPFKISAWRELLRPYPGNLPSILINILEFGALTGYEGPSQSIFSKNHASVTLAPDEIRTKIFADLLARRIAYVNVGDTNHLICSPLGLVPKKSGGLRRIHDLSHPPHRSVNAHIDKTYGTLKYAQIDHILEKVVTAGRNCVILKRDVKDAFRNIPIAPQHQWLLGFQWEDQYYMERCLPFGLATAPFIFNLFAEGLHWILQSWLHWDLLDHYLDDFMLIIPASPYIQSITQSASSGYIAITDLLGIPRNDSKDECGTVVAVLGYEVDTSTFTLRVPYPKLVEAYRTTADILGKASISLYEAESLAGFLGFCAPAVKLGRVFMRSLWSFIAAMPEGRSKFIRRRIPTDLRYDLIWWRDLLPHWNGVCFFDTVSRPIISLYTDASRTGLGGFYISGLGPLNTELVPEENAFAVPIDQSNTDKHFDINIHEMEAINYALKSWGSIWASSTVIVFTDNKTSELGLLKQTLRSPANTPLRQTLLRAAALDITLQPTWIEGSANVLADALSRFDYTTIANLCPHWQNCSISIPQRLSTTGQPA